MKALFPAVALATALGSIAGHARADLTIGVILPLTGSASSFGIPAKNALALWPDTIAGEKVKMIVLDDESDPTKGNRNARRLISEDKVDMIVGSVLTPTALSISEVAHEGKTVQFALAPIELPEDKGHWVFRIAHSNAVWSSGLVDHMKKNGVKTLGFLGYSDSHGETYLKYVSQLAKEAGITITNVERFSRTDTSVTAQALKVVGSKPDAILVVASGGGAAMPHKALIDRGYKGKIYQTASAAARDYLRLGGKDVEGAFVVVGPTSLPESLPDSYPAKKAAVSFVERYEKLYGANTRNQFSPYVYDPSMILEKVVPEAKKKGQPGTPEFRAALRDALENAGGVVTTQGVLRWTAKDHFGRGDDSRMMATVYKGEWKAITPAP
jgi:branched-chain amino acid transport system substrate-binding protein